MTLHYPAQVNAGDEIELSTAVKPAATNDVRIPVQYIMTDSAGTQRAVFYRLSGPGQQVRYPVSSTEPGGNYSVSATGLLTGLTAEGRGEDQSSEQGRGGGAGRRLFICRMRIAFRCFFAQR